MKWGPRNQLSFPLTHRVPAGFVWTPVAARSVLALDTSSHKVTSYKSSTLHFQTKFIICSHDISPITTSLIEVLQRMNPPPPPILFAINASGELHNRQRHTRAVQWKTGRVVLKIACKTDVIVCRVCEGGDDGVGTPATRIGTWEIVWQEGGALATVHQATVAKCCEIFV